MAKQVVHIRRIRALDMLFGSWATIGAVVYAQDHLLGAWILAPYAFAPVPAGQVVRNIRKLGYTLDPLDPIEMSSFEHRVGPVLEQIGGEIINVVQQ